MSARTAGPACRLAGQDCIGGMNDNPNAESNTVEFSNEKRAALQRAWQDGKSPWEAILPYLDWKATHPQLGSFFGSIRDFVAAAASEPLLASRHVYPSTIGMTIFKTSDPVERADAALHARVVVKNRSEEQAVEHRTRRQRKGSRAGCPEIQPVPSRREELPGMSTRIARSYRKLVIGDGVPPSLAIWFR